jgi:putative MATE family efflux protein
MQTTRSASNNRVGLFARSSAVLSSSSRRRQPRRRHFTTTSKNNDAKTRGGKVFRAHDKRREEDNLEEEEDKEEDRNVPFLYDEILYQFGEDQEEDSFDETSREDEEEEEEQRRPAGLLSKTTTTTTTTKRVTKVEIMGAGDSKPTSASSSEQQQQQILLQQQKQKQNRPIDVAEAMRVGDKSKDAGGLHPRGHGAMGKQPLNSSNALNSGNETALSSTRDPKSPKMMGSGQKSPRPIAGTSSLVVQNGRKEKEIDFPALTLRQVVKFAVPALGAVLCDPVMTLVDTACVGRISATYLAALGPNTSIFGFVAMIFQFLTIATTGMVSRNMDAKDAKGLAMVISDALTIAIVMGVLAAFGMIVFAVPLLDLMQTQPHVMQPAVTYLRTRAFTMPCFLITLVGTATCLGQRDSQSPMKIFAFAGGLNLVLDLYLVIGPPKMGIAGAAIATAISQTFGALIFLRKLSRNHNLMFRMPTRARSKPFITAGGVLSVRSVCIMLFYSYAAALASTINVVTIAAHQVVAGIVSVAQFCPEPLSACAQSVLATAGPRNANGFATSKESLYVRKAGRLLLLAGLGLGAGVGAICASILAYQPEMFTKNVTVMTEVGSVAPIVFFSILTYCCVCVTDGLVFATGRIEFAALTQVINLPLSAYALWFCVSKQELGLFGIWFVVLGLFILRVSENIFILARDLGPQAWRKIVSPAERMSMEEEDFNDVESQKQN